MNASTIARLSLALLALPAHHASAQQAVADSIRYQAERFIGALASRDIDQFVSLFMPDPDFIYVDAGRIYPDRAALRAAGAGFFGRIKTFKATWNPVKIVVTGPDAGAFTGVMQVTGADTTGAVIWPNGKIWTLVYQRRGGQWWIVQAHEANVPPPRAAAPVVPAARP
ncbi:MAG: hypothetical protein EXR93_04030 [Gemmatimonadetes bacterium]|nr:hypothetical protein [Gemmatimonadota bacterium]